MLAFTTTRLSLVAATAIVLTTSHCLWAQPATGGRPWAANVLVPQCYRTSAYLASPLALTEVNVHVQIIDQLATTTLLFTIKNQSQSQQMAEFVLPVATGTVIRGFTFDGAASEPKTDLMERDDARQLFESIVAKLRDPALLEFAGYNLIRTSVFPVPAAGEQRVRIVMEQLLASDQDRIDYVLPRSQSLASDVPWKIKAHIRSSRDIATVYSPSHEIATRMASARESTLSVPDHAASNPGAFRLSYLQASGPLSASLLTYPDREGTGGYFLLLAGLAQAEKVQPADRASLRREITLVIDRSGSMTGEKIEQARAGALQVLSGLEEGELFNIIAFGDQVEVFSKIAVAKDNESFDRAREFIESLTAGGGTALYDALGMALTSPAYPDVLPIVLFLTDGLPTVGETSEQAIRTLAEKQNLHDRRLFTFGVGFDVNIPLLDKLATTTRGFATVVTPGENVEASVSRVFRGLAGPMLADVSLGVADEDPQRPSRIFDVLPYRLPDLYVGDQLIVMGRYRGTEPLHFEVTGQQRGEAKRFAFTFDLDKLPAGQPFVARLWASRKISMLVDQVRDLGADQQLVQNATAQLSAVRGQASLVSIDPRLSELTQSIVALSKEFGILTEYTSFLAEEGIDLSDAEQVAAYAQQNLVERAIACRTGSGAWNQQMNNAAMRGACLNLDNRYLNAEGQWMRTVGVQQCRDNTLYQRRGRWVEARLLDEVSEPVPDREVQFGSPEFLSLVWELVQQGRQDEIALEGDILITVGDQRVLIKGIPAPTDTVQEAKAADIK